MADALPKNFIDYEEYPQTAEIQNRCVNMIARMYNAPTSETEDSAMGTSTVGSSEAIMLGTSHWSMFRHAHSDISQEPSP